jgi:hypothetical protein
MSFRGHPRLPTSLRLNLVEDRVEELCKLVGEWPSWPHSYEAGEHFKLAQRGRMPRLFCKTPPRGHLRLPTSLRLNLVEDRVEELCKLVGERPSWPHSWEAGQHTKLAQRGRIGRLFCKTPPMGHLRLPTSLRLNLREDWAEELCKLVGEWPSWPHSYEAGDHSQLAQRGRMPRLFCKTPPMGHLRLPTSLRLNLVEERVEELCKLVGEWPSWPHSYEAG